MSYEFVYKRVMTRSSILTPSVSRAGTLMKGWSAGHMERLGSFLFCNCQRSHEHSVIGLGDTTYPRVTGRLGLHQNRPLHELDGGKFDTITDIS